MEPQTEGEGVCEKTTKKKKRIKTTILIRYENTTQSNLKKVVH